MSRSLPDSIDADPSDVTRLERRLDGDLVTIIVVDADDESRVIVDGEEWWEFDVDDDDHARPRIETTVPVWMEGLLQQIGIRGLRIGPAEGK